MIALVKSNRRILSVFFFVRRATYSLNQDFSRHNDQHTVRKDVIWQNHSFICTPCRANVPRICTHLPGEKLLRYISQEICSPSAWRKPAAGFWPGTVYPCTVLLRPGVHTWKRGLLKHSLLSHLDTQWTDTLLSFWRCIHWLRAEAAGMAQASIFLCTPCHDMLKATCVHGREKLHLLRLHNLSFLHICAASCAGSLFYSPSHDYSNDHTGSKSF